MRAKNEKTRRMKGKKIAALALATLTAGVCLTGFTGCFATINYQLSEDGTYYIAAYTGILAEGEKKLVIPSEYKGKPIKEIGDYFYGSLSGSVKEIVISEGITRIDSSAFSYAGIERIELPSSLKEIGENAFYGCDYLKDIVIPDGVETIGEWAFTSCDKLESVTIGSGVTEIGAYAFNYTALKTIMIPDNVKSLGNDAFYNCDALESVTIGDGVERLEADVFGSCDNLKSVTIGDGVKVLEEGVFAGLEKLESVTLPDGLEAIEDGVFENCTALKSITFGSALWRIGEKAFYGCRSLESVIFKNAEGWQAAATAIDGAALAVPATAAQYLRSTYYNLYWERIS